MNISRRALAQISVASAAAFALSACAGKTADQLTADVNLIVAGLNSIIPTLAGLPANMQPPAAVMAQIQQALDDLKANAASVGTSLAPNADKIQAVAQIISTLSALVAPFFPMAPIVNTIIQAALAMVPGLLAMIAKPAPAAAARAAVEMTPDAARVVLRAAAARH